MSGFLQGLLRDLEQRCVVLKDRLVAIPADPEVRDHAIGAYQIVEAVRRAVVTLLQDPSFGAAALLPNYLQQYKRWNEQVTLVENFPLPFVERYAKSDRRLTRLTHQFTVQARWPLPGPLVGAFSSQYYWTPGEFNLIAAPTTADTTLLGFPDLCHELGHILLIHHEAVLAGNFLQELIHYIAQEQLRVQTGQRPPTYAGLYDQLLVQWRDRWQREFVADMVATFLVGPAYGWQHVRLCAGTRQATYFPSLGQDSDHPADEARLRGVLAILDHMAAGDDGASVRALWDGYIAVGGERKPVDYDVCYPQMLLDSLVRYTIDGCGALGLRPFIEPSDTPRDIAALVIDAWRRFLADPANYAEWERATLEEVWRELAVAHPEVP